MDDELRRLTEGVDFNGPVDEQRLSRAEDLLGYHFPSPYREFLLETGGGEGPVGEHGWVSFYSVGWLVEATEHVHAESAYDQFEGLVIFAGDGGGETYCFDAADQVWRVNWISSPDDNMLLGSFMDFLRAEAADVWDPKAEDPE